MFAVGSEGYAQVWSEMFFKQREVHEIDVRCEAVSAQEPRLTSAINTISACLRDIQRGVTLLSGRYVGRLTM